MLCDWQGSLSVNGRRSYKGLRDNAFAAVTAHKERSDSAKARSVHSISEIVITSKIS